MALINRSCIGTARKTLKCIMRLGVFFLFQRGGETDLRKLDVRKRWRRGIYHQRNENEYQEIQERQSEKQKVQLEVRRYRMSQMVSNICEKRSILISGILEFPLQVGEPACYFYNGRRVKTARVKRIVEIALDHACFETANLCYRIDYFPVAMAMAKKAG